MSLKNTLWTEKYRPNTLEGYVFTDENQKNTIQKWIANKDIPHVLFSGPAGTGKTTIAKILVNEVGIDSYDFLEINASRERGIDIIREKIDNFAALTPWGKQRIILLDEADGLTPDAQNTLKGVIEQYSQTSRFMFTCNNPHRIIPPIHSRTQSIQISKLPIDEYTVRMAEILVAENIDFELETLDDYVRGCWPDLRKCINTCQQNCIEGKLTKPDKLSNATRDYKIDAVELFKNGKVREARALICSQIRAEELEEFYVFCYNNLDLWGTTNEQKDAAILIIRKGLVQIPLAADPEILVAATLVELSQIT